MRYLYIILFAVGFWCGLSFNNGFNEGQYNQMIRTCEAAQEGRKCILVAAPLVEKQNEN